MRFKKIIGIDFGTVNSRVITPEKGIIYEQPTIVAFDKIAKKIITVGAEAEGMLGKTPVDIDILKPLKNGVLLNYRAAEAFLTHLITMTTGRISLSKPSVVIGIPFSISSVERRALEEAATNAGASEIYLFPSGYLSALGAELDISRPFGNMVVNIGGGTTEAAVISLNGVVCSNASKYASLSINEALSNHFKKIYGLFIGESMAEKIKRELCNAVMVEDQSQIEVRGRDVTTGMPKNIVIKTNDIYDAVKQVLNHIVMAIRVVLEKTPPELSSDIVDTGMVISGGGVLLKRFDELLIKALGIPVVYAETPEHTVSQGIHKVLINFDELAYKGKI